MRILQAIKRIIQKEVKEIETETKVLDEKRGTIQRALAQSKTACKDLPDTDRFLKGLFWTGWKVNSIETPTMLAGQEFADVRFLGIEVDGDHVRPIEYQETLTNPDNQLADMQRIVADVRGKLAKMGEWYPIILTRNPYYTNYFESRVK